MCDMTHSYVMSFVCDLIHMSHVAKETYNFKTPTNRSHPISQSFAIGVSLNLNLQSQSSWSLFSGTWLKRPRELDHRMRFENEEMTLQMQ